METTEERVKQVYGILNSNQVQGIGSYEEFRESLLKPQNRLQVHSILSGLGTQGLPENPEEFAEQIKLTRTLPAEIAASVSGIPSAIGSMYENTARTFGDVGVGFLGAPLEDLGKSLQKIGTPYTPSRTDWVSQAITAATGQMPVSILSPLPAAITGAIVGGPPGAAAGMAVGAFGLYGADEYQSFLDDYTNNIKATHPEVKEEQLLRFKNDPEVQKYAILSGLSEGAFEAVSDFLQLKMFGAGIKVAKSEVRNLVKQGASKWARTTLYAKEFGKAFPREALESAAVEIPTEMATAAVETALRQQAGIPTSMTPGEAAVSVIPSVAGMSMGFAGLRAGGHVSAIRARDRSQAAIPEVRKQEFPTSNIVLTGDEIYDQGEVVVYGDKQSARVVDNTDPRVLTVKDLGSIEETKVDRTKIRRPDFNVVTPETFKQIMMAEGHTEETTNGFIQVLSTMAAKHGTTFAESLQKTVGDKAQALTTEIGGEFVPKKKAERKKAGEIKITQASIAQKGKIHKSKDALGFSVDEYGLIKTAITGKTSAKDFTNIDAGRVIGYLESLGEKKPDDLQASLRVWSEKIKEQPSGLYQIGDSYKELRESLERPIYTTLVSGELRSTIVGDTPVSFLHREAEKVDDSFYATSKLTGVEGHDAWLSALEQSNKLIADIKKASDDDQINLSELLWQMEGMGYIPHMFLASLEDKYHRRITLDNLAWQVKLHKMTVPTAAILSELLKTKGLWKLEGANVRPTWLGRKEAEGRYIGRPYNNTQYSIELNPILYRYKNAFEIVLHEIGHYYWFNFLPQEIKDKYNSWHKHLKVLEYQDMDRLYEEIWKYFYTKDASYALTNPRELYAELFSQHIIAKMRSSAKQGVTKRWSIDKKIPAGVAKNLKAILESPPGDFPIRDESVQTFKEMHETLGLSSLGATFEDEELFQAQQPIYTSKLQQELSAMPSNIKPESVKNYLLRKGVKPEEIEWSGLEYNIKPYFDGMLTKEEFINRVNVEVAEYTTKTWVNPEDVAAGIHAGPDYEGYTLAGGSSSYKNIAFYIPTEHPLHGYIPSRKHFGPEGTFAHARVDIRTLSDGRKVLFVEEIQSDAFAGKEPPTAPLAKTWYELVFRRLYRMAAEEGLDGLAWASGEQQREIQRWNLDPENLVRRITGSKVFYDQKLRGYASRFGKQFGVQPGIAPLEGRTDPSNFLPITPEIRETVKNKPIEIFQNEVNKAVLGRFSETAPGAFLINLYNGSDLSTIIHETFHWWVKTQFTPEEFRRAHDIYSNAKTDIEFHEMLANDFQQYLKDGTTRHKHLQSIFLKFRQWLVDMWKNLKGVDEDTALKPEVREFFDSLMADDTITGEDLHNSLVIESDQNEKSVLLQAASIANRNPGAYGVLWEKIKDYLARRTTLSGWFNLHDARNLAKVAPYYASKVEAIEKQYNPILHKIRALLPDKADRTALFLNYDNPKTWSSLPADVRSRLEPVRKLLIKAYEDILKILQSRGIVERDFYETEYLRLQKEEVEAHKKGNTEQAEAIHYQANLIWDPDKNKPKARFQHLPVMFLLDKLRVERPKIFRRVIRTLTNQNRSTLFAADLYDNPTLKKEGISIELADPIIGLGLYISRFARDMAMYDILNAAKQDGMAKYVGNTTLQSTKNEIKRLLQSGEGWIRPSSFAPALRGWVVKDVFASYISEMTQSTESFIPLERIFLLAKMGQFALPFGLSIYNSFQYAMRLGAGRMAWESLKTAAPFLGKSSLRIAVEAKVGNTEDWQTFKNLGASSDPGLNPYVSRLEDLKRISKGFTGDFALHLASIVLRGGYEKAGKYTETGLLLEPWQKAIDVFKGYDESKSKALTALGLPVSAIKGWYQASYKVAWELEELTRFALYDNLLKKGFSSEQAVEQTRLFIGDYADIPRRTRRILNGILFTPSFQMSMARLFLYMIKDTGRVFFDSVRGLPIDKQEQAYAAGLLHTIGILFAMDLLMHAFGFDTEEFGYKYKKKVKTDRGDKDFIWTFPSPVSFLVKYAYRTQRIFNGDPTQSEGQRYVNEFKWQLHPIYLVAWQTLNGKTLNGQEIYSTFDNPIVKRGKSLLFASGSIFRILQIAALTPQGPLGYEVPLYMETGMDDKEAREVIDKEFTALMKVISFTGYGVQHLRAPKEIRAAAQIRRLQAQLLTKAKKSVQDPRYKITEKQMENFRKQIKDVIDSIRD